MKSFGIIGAMESEIIYLKDCLTGVKEVTYGGFKFYEGMLKELQVILCASGIGKINSSLATQTMILKFQLEGIINIGTAGTLTQRIKVGDMVVSEKATFHDVKKLQMVSYWPFKEEYEADEYLVKKVYEAYNSLNGKDYKLFKGKCVTGDIFVASDEMKYLIANECRADCVEMEGGAIAQVAYINKIPYVIVRSICNNADDRASALYNEYDGICINNVGELVKALLIEISNDQVK